MGSIPVGAAQNKNFMESYLDISRAEDLENKRERRIYRFFEILPGSLTLATLALALFLSWLKPVWVAIFILLFDFFWTLQVYYLTSYQVLCFYKMRKSLKTDWRKKLEKILNWQETRHLIFLPMVKENWDVVKDTLECLRNADYPKEKIIVVLAQEERAGEEIKEIAFLAEKNYGNCFGRFLVSVHPKDLENEVIGKGSNVAFASKIAKEYIDANSIPYEKIIISTFDIDTKIFPQYLLCLTYHFLTCEKPQRSSFQPIPIYHNNIWDAPAFTRVIATSNSFWQMMQQERPEQLVTYSSHSMPAKPFFEVGYPKTVVSDDSRIFWKAFLKYNGDYRVVPLYYPVSMDVLVAENFWKTCKNQYKQQKRWAWGCIEIPYCLFGFLKNKKIPFKKKFFSSVIALEGFWAWACASLLILVLGWLPLILGGKEFNVSILSYNLPRLTSLIMIFAMAGIFVSAFSGILFLPKKPKRASPLKFLSVFFQWLLLPITLIAFGSFPAIDAQIRLMFGKYLEFWNTPKVRKQ